MAGWTSSNFMDYSPVNYVGHTHAEPSYAIQASDGSIYYSTTSAVTQDDSGWGDTFTSSDIIGCAIDIDNGKLYWSKNGTWMNSGVPTSGSTGTGAFNIADTATNYFGSLLCLATIVQKVCLILFLDILEQLKYHQLTQMLMVKVHLNMQYHQDITH